MGSSLPIPFVPPPRSALAFGAQLYVFSATAPSSALGDAIIVSLQRLRARSYAEHAAAFAAAARRRARLAQRARAEADEDEDDREASESSAPKRVAGWRSDAAALDNAAAWPADEEPEDVAQARQGALARDVTDVSGEAFIGRQSTADATAVEAEGALSALRSARKEAEAREDEEDEATVAAAISASATGSDTLAVVQLLNSICSGVPAANNQVASSVSLRPFPGSSASLSALVARCSFGGAEQAPSSGRPGRAHSRCLEIARREAEIAASGPEGIGEGGRRHQLWAAASEAFDCDDEGADMWNFHPLGARFALRLATFLRVQGDSASALLFGDVTAEARRAAQATTVREPGASSAPALGALLRRQLASAGLTLLAAEANKAAAVVAASAGPTAPLRDTRVLTQAGSLLSPPRGHLTVERSTQSPAICSVCEVVVRGLSLRCSICGHGGHEAHLRAYFSGEVTCASGCGCVCVDGGGLTGLMRRALPELAGSRAVSGDATAELVSARYDVDDEEEMAAYAS